jgi:hypothetical protein
MSDIAGPFVPSLERMRLIVETAQHFLRGLTESNLVKGAAPPLLLPEEIALRKIDLPQLFREWEKAMNPEQKPLDFVEANGVRPPLIVVNWPDINGVGRELAALQRIRRCVINHWGLAELVTAQESTILIATNIRRARIFRSVLGHIEIQKPLNWPPPIPVLWQQQASYSLQLLTNQLAEVTRKPPPDPYAEPRRLAKDMSPVCRNIIEAVCDHKGAIPLGELAAILNWRPEIIGANFQQRKKDINKAFKKTQWRLDRQSNEARLTRISKNTSNEK